MSVVSKIRINHLESPVGIAGEISVGWVLESDTRGAVQEAYEIQISLDKDFNTLIYDSGFTRSDESAHVKVKCCFEDIKKYYIRVCATVSGEETPYCLSSFITGYQDISSWQGSFISAETQDDALSSGGTYIRKSFNVKGGVKSAYLVSTAHGLYEAYMNGEKIGDAVLAPGWTSYDKRLLYQTYEIDKLLTEGENVLGIHLGAGWYKGEMSFNHKRNIYGFRTAFGGAVIIDYEDGSRQVIASGDTWKGIKSPVLFSEIYDGEIYDAGQEIDGWNLPGFDDGSWNKTEIEERDIKTLVPQEGCLIKEITEVTPKALIITPEGDTVIDFGQNLTGWCHMNVEGAAAKDKIELKFFEVLDSSGNVYTENLRTAKQTITYICRGAEREVYHPHFTFQGFRYMKVASWPGKVSPDNFTAYAIHSDMRPTGHILCSDPLINQLEHNILWSMKGNFLDIPTDCPQRDERLGWTGDAQIFCRSAMFLMDTYTFFSKWLKDLAADQTLDGAVPHVVPDILTGRSDDDRFMSEGTAAASAWADAAVIIPWNMYLVYGDTDILSQQYDSMKRWIDFMEEHSEGCLYEYDMQFGDWVALDAEEGSYFGATPTAYTCAAFYCYSTGLFAKTAGILGNVDDAGKYGALYESIVKSFRKEFFTESGLLRVQTQTAHIVALHFNLVPEEYVESVTKKLKELLSAEDGHLVTGFIGTPYFTHALSENGCLKEAYELLLKEDYPSWLYQVKMGATTIWEHWDGLKPDGTMWSADMNSFNHYAYGSVGDWLYRVAGGLDTDPDCPGYKHFFIRPQIGGNLSFAEVSFGSIYGEIFIRWEKDGNLIKLNVKIPANTTATVILSDAKQVLFADGLDAYSCDDGFKIDAASGSYEFKYI